MRVKGGEISLGSTMTIKQRRATPQCVKVNLDLLSMRTQTVWCQFTSSFNLNLSLPEYTLYMTDILGKKQFEAPAFIGV